MHRGVDPDRLIELIGGATLPGVSSVPDRQLDDRWVNQTAAIVGRGVSA